VFCAAAHHIVSATLLGFFRANLDFDFGANPGL
jgi:hypothetical protein